MFVITAISRDNPELGSLLYEMLEKHKINSLTQFSKIRYTEITSLQIQVIHPVEADTEEHFSLHIYLSSLLPVFYLKKRWFVIYCRIEHVTLESGQKDFSPLDIQLHSKASTALWRGLRVSALFSIKQIRLTNKIRDSDQLNGAIRRIMTIQLILKKVEVIRVNKEKVFNEHKKGYECDCGGSTQSTQRQRLASNYIWSNHIITILKASDTKSSKQVQKNTWEGYANG